MNSEIDFYEVLDIDSDAEENTIRSAYRKKTLTCHPDKHPNDPKAIELFHVLTQALLTLTNPSVRKKYNLKWKKLRAKKRKLFEFTWSARITSKLQNCKKHNNKSKKTLFNYNPKICPLSTITISAPVIVPRNDKHKKPENLTKRWGSYQKIHPMTMNDFPSEEEDDDNPINIKIVH